MRDREGEREREDRERGKRGDRTEREERRETTERKEREDRERGRETEREERKQRERERSETEMVHFPNRQDVVRTQALRLGLLYGSQGTGIGASCAAIPDALAGSLDQPSNMQGHRQ